MRLLLTRAKQDSDSLAAKLIEKGHTAVISPLLEISYLRVCGVPSKDIQAIVATSRHGLIGLSQIPELRTLTTRPLFVVGKSTEKVGAKLGYEKIFLADGRASDLIGLISKTCGPEKGAVLYPRGSHISFDLKQELQSSGFQVISPTVYDSRAVGNLTDEVWNELQTGTLGGVVLLSPRTARIYSELIITQGKQESVWDLKHFCLSKRVADNISIPDITNKYIPDFPRLSELIELIDNSEVDFQ